MTSEIIDYGQFADRLRQWQQGGSRWELLDAVQREWGYEDPGGEPGHSRWGGENRRDGIDWELPVPQALNEWWDSPLNSFAFNPRLYWVHTQWPPTISDLEVAADSDLLPAGGDRRVCVFMSEYHYSHEWGYLAAEAELPDPRVVVSIGGAWVVQSRSLSEFLMQLAFERMPAHYGWTLRIRSTTVDADPEIVRRLTSSYRELGLLPWQEMGTDALSYGAPDAVVRHGRGPGADFRIVINARTRDALIAVAETLGVDWSGDKAIRQPAEVPAPLENLGPVSLAEGDADPRGRWRVLSRGPFAPPAVPDAAAALVPAPGALRSVAADQHGTTLVAGDADGSVHVLETDDESPETITLSLHRAPVTALACVGLGNGRRLVLSGDEHGVIRYWSTRRKPLRAPFARRGTPVRALAAARLATGPALAAAWADGLVRVWDIGSDAVAGLRLGTGIRFLGLDEDGTLHVTDGDGTSALRLDPARLWPHRDLQLRLEDVDWGSLWTARGPGHMIPELIGKVTSDDKKTAMDAVHDLYRLLVSKEASSTAAVPAIPFLVELMTDPDNTSRSTLLLLIADLADVRQARGGRGDAQLAAVREALPTLRYLHDDPESAIRWAANELEQNCAASPAS
ncbi:WD40 repeat domain-containing protein [Streptomyces sp. NPDC059002]|uniref:WD40 repeat domain-containing protein n=1 Tax=Streptomyces sp. NPDC059002 TaxID=3346690 RepID=UPI00369E4604